MQQKSGIKKMLCVLLSILMLVSVCPITASAYEGVTFKAIDGTRGATAGGTENCDKLFDSNLDTKWCVTNFSSAYVVIEASSAIKVSGYQMSTGNDTASEPSRNPKDWVLYGCNDYNTEAKTGTWTVIHKVIGDTVLQSENEKTFSFACDMTDVEYKYFKLEITKNSGTERCMQLSEFAFTDCVHETTVVGTGEADCTNYGYVEKSCSVCSLTYKMITEDAKGHTWEEKSKTPATCTEGGKINQECSVCEATQTVNDPDVPAKGHTWTDVDRTPATCTEGGKINQKCSVCNETRSIDDPDVPSLGHEFDVDGHCTRCGASLKATVTADSATAFVDKNVSISVADGYLFYRATAQKDGMFTFYTTGKIDTYGYLLPSSDLNTDNSIMTSDDEGGGVNCRIDYCASKGETVYFAVKYYSPYVVDELFDVHIDFEEAYVDSGVFYVKDTDADTKKDIYYVGGYKFDTPTDVTILSKINDIPVTYIAKSAFRDCEYLTSITIPSSVKTIYENTFCDCKNLKSVTLGEGIDSIGKSAFSGTAIESITIPNSVKTIYENAFRDCKNLKSVTLGEGIDSIGRRAFYGTAIESITIPGSVKTIYEEAFNACRNLKTVTLGEGIDSINYRAFYGTAIESITIPGSVKTINQDAFRDCRNLKTIILNEGIENIYDWAFGNTAVESVTIPASVKDFNGSVFACCYDLKSISIADANESYKSVDNVVYSKDGTALIFTLPSLTGTFVVPEGVKSIEFDAFYASLISGVKLPSTLETIGYSAFAGCGIYCVDVPASVTEIGSYAFSDSNVEAIIINNKDSNLSGAFVEDSVTIYGHTGSTAETYANNRGNKFVSIDLEEGVECTHSPVNYEIITAPTCTSKGLAKTKCAICGAQGENAEIEMTEHNAPVGVCVECGHKESFVSDVELNKSITCTFIDTSPMSTACFTATKDGTYTATISDMKGIDDFVVASNTARNDFYFELGKETMVFELKAGEQIFIAAAIYGPAYDASFKATVTCNHTNMSTTDATCAVCGKANPNYVAPTPTPTPAPAPAPAPSNVITFNGESIKPNSSGEYVSKKAKKPSINKLSKGRKSFKITWKKVSGVSGYQVQYSTSKKFTKKTTKTITCKGNKKFTKIIKKLKGKKKYYVRVRTYKIVNGKKVYSGWSKVKSVTTKK